MQFHGQHGDLEGIYNYSFQRLFFFLFIYLFSKRHPDYWESPLTFQVEFFFFFFYFFIIFSKAW